MSYRIEQPQPAWRRIDFASVTGFAMAAAGAAAVVVEVNARGWWGFATSWIDLSVLAVWLGLAGWLSGWAFENAEGWWHVPSFLGAVVSVIGVALLLVLAVMSLVSEHPDILTDDSKQKRKGSRNRRRRTRSSWQLPNARGTLTGVGLIRSAGNSGSSDAANRVVRLASARGQAKSWATSSSNRSRRSATPKPSDGRGGSYPYKRQHRPRALGWVPDRIP